MDQPVKPGTDLQLLPGVSDSTARNLNAAGIYTVEQVTALSVSALVKIKGIGRNRAKEIFEYLHRD